MIGGPKTMKIEQIFLKFLIEIQMLDFTSKKNKSL